MGTVLNAVWIAQNDIKQFFKSIRSLTWTFLFPIFMLFAFSFRWGAKGADPEYMAFLIPGVIAMTALMGSTNETLTVVMDRAMGTFDRIVAAPVSSTSIILGKTLSGVTLGFLSAVVLAILGKVFYNFSMLYPLFVFPVILLSCFAFTGIATIISAISSNPHEALMLANGLRFPMVILSGVFFPVEAMPLPFQIVAKIFPLTYATEAIRAFNGELSLTVYIDIAVLVVYSLATIILGSRIFLKIITK